MGDMEDFLRKAAQRRQARKAQRQPENRTPSPARRPPVSSRAPTGSPGVAKRHLESDVAQHVQEHIKAERISAHAARLGEGVRREDQAFEAHIQAVFGTSGLTGEPASASDTAERRRTDKPPAEPASRGVKTPSPLLDVFRNADQLRQAVIIAEILRRPVERW